MPDYFWPDLLVATIATTFGAILTVAIAFATYRYELRSRERDAVRHLAHVLASRRALVPANPVRVDASLPDRKLDLEACRRSVQHAREAVVEASRSVRPGSQLQGSLDSMARSTNRFLDDSRHDPDGYWLQLNDLRVDFISSLAEMSGLTKQPLPEPGSRA